MDDIKTEKYYYTIGEVAKMFNVNTSLIRYWENEFDVLRPRKNKKGNRLCFRLVKIEGDQCDKKKSQGLSIRLQTTGSP